MITSAGLLDDCCGVANDRIELSERALALDDMKASTRDARA
jgi:hypothetical protein